MIKSLFASRRHRLFWKISFWLVLALMLFLTLTPSPVSPVEITHIDKLFHFLAFAGFTFVFCVAFQRFNRGVIFGASILLGAGIEFVQYFIPNRGASIGDLMADGLGALMGLVVVIYLLPNPKPLVQSE